MKTQAFIVGALACGIVYGVLLVTGAVPVSAQNLLEDAKVQVSTNAGGGDEAWVPEVIFSKPGQYGLTLRVEFNVDKHPGVPVYTLKKPQDISDWKLNGTALIGPPKEMFYPELEGIPASLLKVGKNVLEASVKVDVRVEGNKLRPATSGTIKLALKPGALENFEIRTGPVLGAAGYDYFTVGCRTRMPATVTLHCDGRTWTSKPGVLHGLRADGLKEGTEYEYKLVARSESGGATVSSKTWKVKTLSRKGPWTFVAFGDARNNPKVWGLICAETLKVKPDFVMHTGDIIGNGNDYEGWDKEFAKPSEAFLATIPCFYTFGNHENNCSLIYELFGIPPGGDRGGYTQTVGPVQIFAMNRFENWGKKSKNLVRMEQELADSKAPFIFAFTHVPAWSSGEHGNDKLGQEIHYPIFDKYGVTALIAGHDHCYERSEPGGTTMLIAGGAGAHLYKKTHAEENPYSKIYRSEYGFLVFSTDGSKCTMKAYVYGGLNTPDDQRKQEQVDSREWNPRKLDSKRQD